MNEGKKISKLARKQFPEHKWEINFDVTLEHFVQFINERLDIFFKKSINAIVYGYSSNKSAKNLLYAVEGLKTEVQSVIEILRRELQIDYHGLIYFDLIIWGVLNKIENKFIENSLNKIEISLEIDLEELELYYQNILETQSNLRIYIISPDYIKSEVENQILNAVEVFLKEFGYSPEEIFDPIYGSFFQIIDFIKKHVSKIPLAYGFNTIRDLINGKQKVEVEEKIVSLSANLISSLNSIDNVCLIIDKSIIIKWKENGETNLKFCRVNEKIAKLLTENPVLIDRPKELFNLIHEETNTLSSTIEKD